MGMNRITIQMRVTAEEKETIERESSNVGLTITAFLLLLVKNYTAGIQFQKITQKNKSDNRSNGG